MLNNNLLRDSDGERMTVNLDQVRVYRFRKEGSESSQLSRGISQFPRSHESTSSSSGMPRDNFQPRGNFRAQSKIQTVVPAKSYENSSQSDRAMRTRKARKDF